jgi:hypothetical protein
MPYHQIKLDVYGRLMLAERTASGWQLFHLGSDGKRSLARDIVIPDFIGEDELGQYLADIFHESATGKHPGVKRLAE